MSRTRNPSAVKPARAQRNFRERPSLAVSPATVTQLTCFLVLGLNDGRYLAHLRAHPEFPQSKIGNLVVTNVADWQRAVMPMDPATAAPEDDGSEQPQTADDVLRVFNRRTA